MAWVRQRSVKADQAELIVGAKAITQPPDARER